VVRTATGTVRLRNRSLSRPNATRDLSFYDWAGTQTHAQDSRFLMRRIVTTIGTAGTAIALSASVALAAGGVSATAKGHGQAVSEVAQAAGYVSGKARGEAVSALAKQHGALVSAAARAQGAANAAAGKAKGAAHAAAGAANGADASEPGRLKAEAARG